MSQKGMEKNQDRRNFFISYTNRDRRWAEWIGWQLEEAGYTLFIQAWDFRPGSNFVAEMDRAAKCAERTLLVLSPAYLESDYAFAEWAVAFRHDPKGRHKRLLPVLVEACNVEGFLGPVVYIDLVALNEADARERLLEGVRYERVKPAEVEFPGYATLTGSSEDVSVGYPPREDALLRQASHRRIVGFPPPTDSRAIQQREQVVKAVYTQLTQPNNTAIALTGIGGAGKSTLAALVYRYTEAQQKIQSCPFQSETLWLTVDSPVTFTDLIGNIFEVLGKPIPQLSGMAAHTQALTLFNALNTTDKPRLIIFDQFENLLDKTGHALAERPGVGEWLDIMNSQQCTCRFLLTSRPRPIGTREDPPIYLQEYPVKRLEITEGVALLQNRGVTGTEEELQRAVERCERHALSLSLLASLIDEHRLSLSILLKDSAFGIGNITRNRDLLDYLYTKQLNHVQRALIGAFSVYREPVLLEAAEAAAKALITDVPRSQMSDALHVLYAQHLIDPTGEGHYQLHTIIKDYASEHFDEGGEQKNDEARKEVHRRAAEYYQRQTEASCRPSGKRGNVSDNHDLLEAIWHYCKAEQWQEAYKLIEQERVFQNLKKWGSNAVLLEFCSLLQQGNWSPTFLQAGAIYYYKAWAYNALGKREEGREHNELALKFYKESGNLKGQEQVLDALGWSFRGKGQMKQAERYYEQALAICEELGDRRAKGNVLNGLGQVYDVLGRREEAQEYFEQALAIGKETGDPQLEGRSLRNLGYIHTDFGNYAEALGYIEQSLAIMKKSDRRGEGVAYDFSGRVYRERGRECMEQGREYEEQGQDEKAAQEFEKAVQDFERAKQDFEKSLGIYRSIGDRGLEGWALHNLGWTYLASGEYERARTLLEQALAIRVEIGDRRGESRTRRDLGEVASMLGEKKQVLEYYKQALSISKEIEDPYGEGTILQNAALVYFDSACYDVALSCLLRAKRIFDELRNPYGKETQRRMERLQKTIGNEQFKTLLAKLEPKAEQIVDKTLLVSGER